MISAYAGIIRIDTVHARRDELDDGCMDLNRNTRSCIIKKANPGNGGESMDLNRYVRRRPVEIVYMDSKGRTSRRIVSVYSVRDGRVRVLDWSSKSLRTLSAGRIMEAVPLAGWRVS